MSSGADPKFKDGEGRYKTTIIITTLLYYCYVRTPLLLATSHPNSKVRIYAMNGQTNWSPSVNKDFPGMKLVVLKIITYYYNIILQGKHCLCVYPILLVTITLYSTV